MGIEEIEYFGGCHEEHSCEKQTLFCFDMPFE